MIIEFESKMMDGTVIGGGTLLTAETSAAIREQMRQDPTLHSSMIATLFLDHGYVELELTSQAGTKIRYWKLSEEETHEGRVQRPD